MTEAEKTTKAKKPASEHVCIKGRTFYCRHCGQTDEMSLPAPIDTVLAMAKTFTKLHKACRKTEKGLLCGNCFAFHDGPFDTGECPAVTDPWAWWNGPDTGLSSKTIWSHMVYGHVMAVGWGGVPHVPHDADDFGRCSRLLKQFPQWRTRLGEMKKYEAWAALVDAWDELEQLYALDLADKNEDGPSRLYQRLQQLR
jgi:hypothetical protein